MAAPIKFKPIHPIATILGHLRLIGGVTLIGTVIFVLLILWKVKPQYQAGAAIEITQTVGHVLTRDQDKQFVSRIQYTDFVNTQVNYIVSFENVSETLRKVDLNQTSVIQRDTEAETVQSFLSMVEVGWVPNTNLLSVRVSSSDPRGLDLLANTLVDNYMENHKRRGLQASEERVKHLREEEVQQKASLAEMNAKLTDATGRLGTLATEESLSPMEENLSFLRQSLNDSLVARLEAEHILQTLISSIDKENDLGIGSLVEERVLEDLTSMRNGMYENMAELNRASAMMNADHPHMRQLEDQLKRDRENLDKAMADLRADTAQVIAERLDRDQKTALIKAQAEVDSRLRNEQLLAVKYAEEQAKLKEMIPLFLTAEQLRADITRSRERIAQIESRLEEVSIEARAPSRLNIQSRARQPMYPTKNRRKIFAVIALFFCATLGLLIAFAIDFLEASIISPQHMAQLIGQRPTGVLANHKMADFGQLLRDLPESYEADQFRRIMPRIFHANNSREAPGIYAMVPLAAGAGVTSFALNCLVHQQQVGCNVGLLDLSGGDASLEQRTSAWGLQTQPLNLPQHLADKYPLKLRAGGGIEIYSFQKSLDKKDLADKDLLKELLATLSARTGCLLVEAASMLQHAEAELICRLANTTVLVVNGPETAPGQVGRGMGLLRELEVEEVAVIANNLPTLPGGYFAAAKAAFEGEELKYPLLRDIKLAVLKALVPGRKG